MTGTAVPAEANGESPGKAAFEIDSPLSFTSLHGAALGDSGANAVRFWTFTCRGRRTAKAQLPPVPFTVTDMLHDVYDLDDDKWAVWDSLDGYLTGWMTKAQYEKHWKVHYGVIGRSLPNRHTVYRTTADEWEKRRNGRQTEKIRPEGHPELPADVAAAGGSGARCPRKNSGRRCRGSEQKIIQA